MNYQLLVAAALTCFGLSVGIASAGELENFKSGKTVSNDGLPGDGEIKGKGIANGTAEPASVGSFPGSSTIGPGSPDLTTNKTYENAGPVLEFGD